MDHRVSKDMISSGMIPAGEKKKEDLGRTQYGSAPSPSSLADAYKSMYDKKEETLNEHHKKDADGNTIPHEDEEIDEGIGMALKTGLDLVKNIAKKKVVKNLAGNVATGAAMSAVNNLMSGGGGGGQQPKSGTRTTQNQSADLFDIVKGQLLDEGLSEEEIKDIMLTLTPDEILNELSVGKMGDYISAADKDIQKTAASMRNDGSVMGDDPRIKKMTNRAKGMALAGSKIAKNPVK